MPPETRPNSVPLAYPPHEDFGDCDPIRGTGYVQHQQLRPGMLIKLIDEEILFAEIDEEGRRRWRYEYRSPRKRGILGRFRG